MTLPTVKIAMTGPSSGTVEIDGHKIPCVRSISFRSAVGEINTVTIELYAQTVDIEAPAEVKLDVTSIGAISRWAGVPLCRGSATKDCLLPAGHSGPHQWTRSGI
jgi:hypothetical protein